MSVIIFPAENYKQASSGSSSGGSSITLPSDGYVYVVKNGAFVKSSVVDMIQYWQPAIIDNGDILLTVDEDMTPYQLTGMNVEVNP